MIDVPIKDTVNVTVTSVPRSAEVAAPICLRPFLAMIRLGRRTVVNSLSFIFQKRSIEISLMRMTVSTLSTKAETLWTLKLVSLLNDVARGFRIEKSVCDLMKPSLVAHPNP